MHREPMKLRHRGVLAALTLLPALSHSSPECLDMNGHPVEWWAMFKFPNGYQAAFVSSRDTSQPSLRRNVDLSTANQPLRLTLDNVSSNANAAMILYNDQPPVAAPSLRGAQMVDDLQSSTYGHLKGVLAFDGNGGFWLIHSTPMYPQPNTTDYPQQQTIYGQSFLCITLGSPAINTVGDLLLLNKPQVYSSREPAYLQGLHPSVDRVIARQWITPGNATTATLVAKLGTKFVAFAKNAAWSLNLYTYSVAPYFQSPMRTETWIRNPPLPSYCPAPGASPPFQVVNVRSVMMDGVSWKYTQDHSKWGLVDNNPFVCIGDINRMESQANRGGGTVCFMSPALWQALRGSIVEMEHCDQ